MKNYLLHVPGNEDTTHDELAVLFGGAIVISAGLVSEKHDYCEIFTPAGDKRGRPSEKYPGRNLLAYTRLGTEGPVIQLIQ